MEPFRYSPLPMRDYLITSLPECEVSALMSMPNKKHQAAVWNLSWLSLPTLDALPTWGHTPRWFIHYMPISGAFRAITTDAVGDDVLMSKLLMSPRSFVSWFEREEQSRYECFDALGGMKWVETVLGRATEAMTRSANDQVVPAVLPSNVFHINRKRVA